MAHQEDERPGSSRIPNETPLPRRDFERASIETPVPPEPLTGSENGPLPPGLVPETLVFESPPLVGSAPETLPPLAPPSDTPAKTLSHEPTPPDALAERFRAQGLPVGHSDVRRLDLPGYEVLGELGRGGMGVVYKARHVRLNRTVALKMILGSAHVDADSIARFQREAEAVAQVQHPNIVQIYEIGDHDGLPFFSLEFVEGGSLDRLVSGEPFPSRDVAGLVETISRAMHFAHERGIIHRDLKPANILMQRVEG